MIYEYVLCTHTTTKNTTGYENDDDSREQDKINLVSNRILSLNRRQERVRFLIKFSRYDKTIRSRYQPAVVLFGPAIFKRSGVLRQYRFSQQTIKPKHFAQTNTFAYA